MSDKYFELDKISYKYRDTQVLWDVSIELAPGEIIALVGSNGAGKSTTVKAAAGLQTPFAGDVRFQGESLLGKPTSEYVKRGIVLVPEGRQLFPQMSVYENLEIGAGTKEAKAKKRENIERAYEWFPILKERRNQPAGTLSGGEQQMVAFARGMMEIPKILIMDEPSLGLAPNIVDSIFDIAKTIVADTGLSVILVEQDVRKALKLADRGYVLENGVVSIEGSASDLLVNPEVKKAYLGF